MSRSCYGNNEELFQEEATKERWQLLVACDSGLDSLAIEDIIGTTGKSEYGLGIK
jgi:hypothetical protein